MQYYRFKAGDRGEPRDLKRRSYHPLHYLSGTISRYNMVDTWVLNWVKEISMSSLAAGFHASSQLCGAYGLKAGFSVSVVVVFRD